MAQMFPKLTTKRLSLRPIVESDLESIFHGLSHPDVIRFYGISFDSLEATREQMDWFANLENTNVGRWWAICSLDTHEFLGAGGFNELSQQHRKAEVGFWLLPEAWGKGYMQEAMPAICQAGFEHMGLHRIEGFVESENKACKKALAKLQFHLEGSMRDCEWKNGSPISIDVYSLLNPVNLLSFH